MKQFSNPKGLLALSTCLLGLACGDDDKRSSFSSGLPTNKPAATLSSDDKQQFCRTLDQHVTATVGFEEITRLGCLPLALLSGGTTADCQKFLDSCAAKPPPAITVEVRNTHDQACFDSLTSCEASVGTLEGCINVNVAAIRSVLESISCARVGDSSAATEATSVMRTASTCAQSSSSCGEATTLLL